MRFPAIMVELKSVRRIIKAHEVQLVNYLVATGKPVGLILNSGERKAEIKRKAKDLSQKTNFFQPAPSSLETESPASARAGGKGMAIVRRRSSLRP